MNEGLMVAIEKDIIDVNLTQEMALTELNGRRVFMQMIPHFQHEGRLLLLVISIGIFYENNKQVAWR